MWGGEGGARLMLCYFDRHLNYLIPSLLDNHQNFKIAGGSWVFHAIRKYGRNEYPRFLLSPLHLLWFSRFPPADANYQIPAQFVATQMLCFEVFIQFWFPSIAQDQTQNLRKQNSKKKGPRGNFEKRGTLQSYHYFVPILSIWMCSLQRYLYNFTS